MKLPAEPPEGAPGEEQRYQALQPLRAAAPAGRAALLQALSDPSWRVRAAAAERLAAGGGVAAAELVGAMGPCGSAGRRNAAAAALTGMGAPAVPALLEALGAPAPEVRVAAVEVLGALGDRRASPALQARLADEDCNVRTAAAEALGMVGGPRAPEALRAALAAGDPPLQGAALEALGRLGVALPARQLGELGRVTGLRRPALRLLGFCDEPEAAALLAEALREGVRRGAEPALVALAAQRRRRPRAGLVELAAAVRQAARAEPDLAARIAAALEGAEEAAARGALAALEWIADPATAGPVAAAGGREELRDAAREALRALGGGLRAAVAPALPGLPPEARATVYAALAQVGDREAVPLLQAGVASGEEEERAAAREALSALGSAEPGRARRRGAGRRTPSPAGAAPPEGRPGAPPGPELEPAEFRLLAALVQDHSGICLRDELRFLVERRLAPRLEALGLACFADYRDHLLRAPGRGAELEAAVELLAAHETYLHREPRQLRAFSEEILPALAAENGPRRRLRIWCAGCSTGEEAYTVAILLARSGLFEGWDVSVLGTDLSRRVLAAARAGSYGAHAFRSPEAEALRPWFREEAGRWVVRDEIRRLVAFERLNLVEAGGAAPAESTDAVFCRNVLIYFDLPARRKALAALHRRLRPGGFLLLGHSESLLHVTADFELLHLRHDLVYRRPRFGA